MSLEDDINNARYDVIQKMLHGKEDVELREERDEERSKSGEAKKTSNEVEDSGEE